MAELINNYGDIGALTILVGLMVWYLKYQTKQQTKRDTKHDKIQEEERLFYRRIITNDLKELHKDNLSNAKLNQNSLIMLETLTTQITGLTEYMNLHFNGCVEKVNLKKKVKK